MGSLLTELKPGTAVSPVDGRYFEKTQILSPFFSEMALMRFRLLVSAEYLIALSRETPVVRQLTDQEEEFLRRLYEDFSDSYYDEIKAYESVTNHDVNAVVRFLKEKVGGTTMVDIAEFVHFGLTSEDINNIAFAYMLRGGTNIIASWLDRLVSAIFNCLAKPYQNLPLLARTHGQPASPTTLGWEMNVFVQRLQRELEQLKSFRLRVKFGGATGGHNALQVAYPTINWRNFSVDFITDLNNIQTESEVNIKFDPNPFTTQVEPHDTYAELFSILMRINTILIDFSRDMWLYISQEVFTQKPVAGEDGSSAMPNKINPIDFENAEGNLGIATALMEFFSRELPVSRLQRHLSDSTIIRNFGPAYAHILISLKSLMRGVGKVSVNKAKIQQDLENNWGIVAEAIQTIFRREGVAGGYDLLKAATRGKPVTKEIIQQLIDSAALEHGLSPAAVEELKKITPHNYTGDRCFL